MSSQYTYEHDDCFVQLLTNCQRSLFLYICGLLFSRELAEDVLQETNLILWKKRGEYQSNTNFYAWACRVAFFEVCKARDAHRRKAPTFSDLFLERMALPLQAMIEKSNPVEGYLRECLALLVDRDRNMLKLRYEDGVTTKTIANGSGQSVRTVNRSLARIHEILFDCIHKKVHEKADS